MTKNIFLNDLIICVLFIALMVFSFLFEPDEGLGLVASLAFVPLLVLTMEAMVKFQYLAINKPFRSRERVMLGVSWGVLMGTCLTIGSADFANPHDLLMRFVIQATIMGAVWMTFFSGKVPTDAQTTKQTRFATSDALMMYIGTVRISNIELISGITFMLVGVFNVLWVDTVLGLLLLLGIPVVLSHLISLLNKSTWYAALRHAVVFLSSTMAVYLNSQP